MSVIDEAVSKIPEWKDKRISITPLSGGLTNSNFKVEVDATPYFVRVPGASTELLAINRENEYYNSKAAYEAGVGPKIIHYLPEQSVMVLEFLNGTTMSKDSLNQPGMPTRMAQAIKKLHAGPRFLTDFNMFRLTEYYLQICRGTQRNHPGRLSGTDADHRDHRTSDVCNPLRTVPCNNDLLAENYIDDGEKLWLIDYEYSGNNDPTFELGNTCQEMQFDDSQIQEVCARLISANPAGQDRTYETEHDHVRCRLGLMGRHPGEDLGHRIRLLGLGHRALGQGSGKDGFEGIRSVVERCAGLGTHGNT